MDQLKKTIKEISELKIQGAQKIAIEALKALKNFVKTSKADNVKDLFYELANAKKALIKARPTEPCLRNSLLFTFQKIESYDIHDYKIRFVEKIQEALNHLSRINEVVGGIGSEKISKGMIVFTHCHSSTVMSVLKKAYNEKKRFELHNTETRPLFQGRITAKEAAEIGIPVKHYVDSAARMALKKSDLMLIGCDAITSEGKIINKIGSEMFAEIAHKYDVPIYVCTDSWKFDHETIMGMEEPIENRKKGEVWDNPPKKVVINNPAFEMIDPELITGVITELGVYKPEVLVEIIIENYPWMSRKIN